MRQFHKGREVYVGVAEDGRTGLVYRDTGGLFTADKSELTTAHPPNPPKSLEGRVVFAGYCKMCNTRLYGIVKEGKVEPRNMCPGNGDRPSDCLS